jgi:hypothetical protein
MPFDRSTIAPEAQAHNIEIGKDYASTDVLLQIDRLLKAWLKYQPLLIKHGYTEQLAQLTIDVRDAMQAAGVTRTRAKAEKKATNAALLDAMRVGKNARVSAHSLLAGARFAAELSGDRAAVNAIDAVLDATRRAGADAVAVRDQLHAIAKLLEVESVRTRIADAAALDAMLTTRADAIDIARQSRTRGGGTPAETDLVNLLDGLGVGLSRIGRKAGRAASNETGDPAIAEAVELVELYKSTGRRAADGEDTDTDAT